MTIAPNSTSYPYLAVAIHYDIPYSEVLDYVGFLDGDHDRISWLADCDRAVIFAAHSRERQRRVLLLRMP